MTTDNEAYLWDRIGLCNGVSPRDVIHDMLDKGMINSTKQAWRTLEKWISKGKYEYGVSLDLGWKK